MPNWRSDPTGPRSPRLRRLLLSLLGLSLAVTPGVPAEERHPPLQLFVDAASQDEETARRALTELDEWWRDDYACLLVDLARFMRPRRSSRGSGAPGGAGGFGGPGGRGAGGGGAGTASVGSTGGGTRGMGPGSAGVGGGSLPIGATSPRDHESTRARQRLVDFLEEKTGQEFGDDLGAWRRWYWNRPYSPHPEYAAFKAALYGRVDPGMGVLFRVEGGATIRLDEIDWSGMPPARIPKLEDPKHIPAAEADQLDNKDVIYGLEAGGQARAYPERILVRHELTLDSLGGMDLTIASDALCGTVIAWGSEVRRTHLTFAPSGLVYRSNRLMFDEESASLWSTMYGRPVHGPLTEHNVQLPSFPMVRTTWREWRELHPDTTVLSFDTGYPFDYSRDSFVRRYLDSDRLMFEVPKRDERLDTKEPVLALALPKGDDRHALAIRLKLLEKKENRVFHAELAGYRLVVVTSRDGAQRVYASGDTRFVSRERDGRLRDDTGGLWRLDEAALIPEAPDVSPRTRLPAQRVLWFAWYAQYPGTELVQ